jgi:hypothetical protein
VERAARCFIGLLGALVLVATLRLPPSSERAAFYRQQRLAYCGETASHWFAAGRPARALYAVADGLGIIGYTTGVE